MWIFTNRAFVSIVAARDKPGWFLVRGRFAGDVAHFLGIPADQEVVTPRADYRFRVEANAALVQQAIERASQAIDYPNFKNSVPDHDRHEVYADVWSVLSAAQARACRR